MEPAKFSIFMGWEEKQEGVAGGGKLADSISGKDFLLHRKNEFCLGPS